MATLLRSYRDAGDALACELGVSTGDGDSNPSRRGLGHAAHTTDSLVLRQDLEVNETQHPTQIDGSESQQREVQGQHTINGPESVVSGRIGQRPGRNRGRDRHRQRRCGTSRGEWIKGVQWR
jgi:hypothetical protein